MVEGRVLGHGGTPEQAVRAAQASQYKEKVETRFVPVLPGLVYPAILSRIQEALEFTDDVYLVGGCIRDAVLGLPAHDLDILLPGETLKIARRVAKALDSQLYVMDENRNTVRLITTVADEQFFLDFAEIRGNKLEDDLVQRDFTINSMAASLHHPDELLDPLGGLDDLRSHLIRVCSPKSIQSDPVRILRGIRLAAQYNLRIHPVTRDLMKQSIILLDGVSAERKRDELLKMLDHRRGAAAIRALDRLGAVNIILPELTPMRNVEQTSPHTSNVWEHTLTTLQKFDTLFEVLCRTHPSESAEELIFGLASIRLGRYRQQLSDHFQHRFQQERSRKSLLALAILYHDVGKTLTGEKSPIHFIGHEQRSAEIAERRAKDLALSRDEVEYIQQLIRNHMRIHQLVMTGGKITQRAVYRYFKDLEDVGIDLIIFSLADLLGIYGNEINQDRWVVELDICRELMDAWWEHKDTSVHPKKLIDGDDLMHQFGLKPGKLVGEALEAIQEAQIEGKIQSKGDIPQFMEHWLLERGDKGTKSGNSTSTNI